ncbi:hypothetical protein BOH78_4544 [Pichia kudriavzevii]|uniref:Uncharacterized protein n=1 Tax=Pichia kudriavzevii TaxID=4909 RepID=A0A1V2LH07_PICKU|nr:hypothetical protein BOH78_4544 [Pichia kudriavzevii]
MSDDSFGDDDDFDFDEVVRKAEETQRLLTQQNSRGVTREDATSETNGNMNNGRIQSSKLDNVVYQVKGENAVLRGQIAKLEKEQGEIQDSLRVKYEKMLKDKEEYIRSLTENLNKLKSEYEFAETENRNLMQQNIRSRKIRKIHHDTDSSTPNTSVIESTQNTSYTSNNSNLSTHDTRHDQCLPRDERSGLKVVIMNQAMFFQDEKTHFIESLTNIVKINEIPNLALREMIIVLLKISSRNIKNYSIDFVKQVRESKYNGILFNGEIEQSELDRYGLWNSILSSDKLPGDEYKKLVENRIQIETDTYNGIEFNYPDETIDLARDIVGSAVTGDEADRLHDSINFVNYDDTANEDEDYQMDI